MTSILCEGFDNCPHCGADPPPATTAESYAEHVALCAAGELEDEPQPRLTKLEKAALAGDPEAIARVQMGQR